MSESMNEVKELAEKLYDCRQQKKEYEEHIKSLNEEIKDIEEHKLSGLLTDLGINKVATDDMDITNTIVLRGGYSKHTDKEAFQFLFDSHNDGALKQRLIVDLSMYPRVGFELDMLKIPYEIEYSIHPMTLSSILKELFEQGQLSTGDIEKYSIYVQPQVKIKKK